MTEQLHSYIDSEYSNKLEKLEEEADKLNDLTFNSEIPWEYDEVDFDNDHSFKSFEFDNEIKENISKESFNVEFQTDKNSDDLLGLTGSFINFGIFKSNNSSRENEGNETLKDNEFETAFNKLNLVDKLSGNIAGKNMCLESLLLEESVKNEETPSPYSTVNLESPFLQLTKFSELLHQEFIQYQKSDTSLHVLNQIVSNHLNLLNKELQNLNLSMDILPQLRYFCILMSFVAIDNKLTEIQTKYSSNQTQLNHEIAQIIHHFLSQSPPQQMELCMTHPFYLNLMSMLALQNAQSAVQSNVSLQKSLQSTSNRSENRDRDSLPEWATEEDKKLVSDYQARRNAGNHDANDGSWMSESERDWLIKIQTKNLTTSNPYVHDYYYTQMKLKQMIEARRLQILNTGHTSLSDPLSLLPSPITGEQLGAGIDPNKDGVNPGWKPIQFEKSLGMLSPSNLNTPRQIIQINNSTPRIVNLNHPLKLSSSSLNSSDPSYKTVRSHRELLGLIEKMYSIVLRIDEVDKSLARMLVEQHKSRGVLVQHRNYLLKLLMDCMTNNAKFVDLLSVSKGARIVVSTIAIVSSTQFIQIVRTLFFNCISVWESDFFQEIEQELRSLICSRVRNLKQEELESLISTIYCNVTPNSVANSDNNNSGGAGGGRLQPLSGFCSNQFGLYIILTILDSKLKSNPDEKVHVTQLLSITIKSTESQTYLQSCMKDFKHLFPSNERR